MTNDEFTAMRYEVMRRHGVAAQDVAGVWGHRDREMRP